ncbi:MAG TPA: AraC family transcriptional regulator [Magnetospirillaceae bacterium]|jgi:AraC-like DNA-binding protein
MSGLMGVFAASFGRIVLASKAQAVAEHAHPHMHLLFKVDGADRVLDVAGQRHRLTESKAVAVNPWQPHSEPGPIEGETTVLTFYIHLDWIAERFGDLSLNQFSEFQPDVSAEAQRLVADIVREIGGENRASPIDVAAAVQDLVGHTLSQGRAGQYPRSSADFRIRRAIDMIRTDPARPRNLGVLATQVGLSRSRFFTQFHEATGVSPRLYANAVWLERAVEALLVDERPIGEVSDALGFATHSHFCRFFREKIGFTPREYQTAAFRPSPSAAEPQAVSHAS